MTANDPTQPPLPRIPTRAAAVSAAKARRAITYSTTIGVYPVANYPRLCDAHATARGLGGLLRTGVAAAPEPAACEDCSAQRLLDAIKVAGDEGDSDGR